MVKKRLTKKQKRRLRNRAILAVISAVTIYVLFFNNALSFLVEVGLEKTNNLRVILGIVGLFFSIGWATFKSQKGEI